jgi:hypothetical protein
VGLMDYAAILSKQEIPMRDIIQELDKRGWNAYGKELLDFEEIPHDVLVWLLFKWETFGYPDFPIKGYLRVVPKEGTNNKHARFHVVQSSWYIKVYYTIVNETMVRYFYLKRLIEIWLTKLNQYWKKK